MVTVTFRASTRRWMEYPKSRPVYYQHYQHALAPRLIKPPSRRAALTVGPLRLAMHPHGSCRRGTPTIDTRSARCVPRERCVRRPARDRRKPTSFDTSQ